ncbi:hypothetical protein FS749_008732, partial [Ceratobasidium sp. UAMH 11750]
RLQDIEDLILGDIGLPPRTTQFTPRNHFIGFPPNLSMGLLHATLHRDVRRLVDLRTRDRTWAQHKRRWTIVGDELLLRCMRVVCRIPEPW